MRRRAARPVRNRCRRRRPIHRRAVRGVLKHTLQKQKEHPCLLFLPRRRQGNGAIDCRLRKKELRAGDVGCSCQFSCSSTPPLLLPQSAIENWVLAGGAQRGGNAQSNVCLAEGGWVSCVITCSAFFLPSPCEIVRSGWLAPPVIAQ
jgi:hypothetical protein